MSDQLEQVNHAEILRALKDIIGDSNVSSDEESLVFYSTDVYRRADVLAAAVVKPKTVDQLQEIVRYCAKKHCALVVRGGGASYTDGYLPIKKNTICVDMAGLNKIVDFVRLYIDRYKN